MSDGGMAVMKVNYSHDAMIDLLVADPRISQGRIAAYFGYTQPWVSRVMSSDAFKKRFMERRKEVVDPVICQAVEERFDALLTQSIDIVQENLMVSRDPRIALKAMELSARGLGVGGFGGTQTNVQVNTQFVVEVPQKAVTSEGWLESIKGSPIEGTPEMVPVAGEAA